jgi:hypothetical protein
MINNTCPKPSFAINYSINIALHIVILFGVLSALFTLYISEIIKEHIEEQLHDVIKDNLKESLNKLPEDRKQNLKLSLRTLPLEQLIKLNAEPSKAVSEHNKWLFILIGAINLFLMIAVVLTVGLLSGVCGQCVPIGWLLAENALIFTFVGIVEFLFFKFIILKYVPAPPSLLVKSIFDGLKNKFV